MHRFKMGHYSRNLTMMTYAGNQTQNSTGTSWTQYELRQRWNLQLASSQPSSLQPTCYDYTPTTPWNFWILLQFVLRFDPADRFQNTRAHPADATHGRRALPAAAEIVMVWSLGLNGSGSTAVSAQGKGLINMYLVYYQWTSLQPFHEILMLDWILELVWTIWKFHGTNW